MITLVWAIAAYLIIPKLWVRYFRRHPVLRPDRRVLTQTGDGHPGDPINIGLIGSESRNYPRHDEGGLVSGRPDHLGEQRAHRRGHRAASARRRCAGEQSLPVRPQAGPRLRAAAWAAAPASGTMSASGVGTSSMRDGQAWFGAATYDRAWASATPPARSPITSARMSMPSVTAWSKSCSKRESLQSVNGSTASTRRLRAITAAAIPGAPMDASPWSRSDRSEVTDSAPFCPLSRVGEHGFRTRARTPRGRMLSPRPEPPLSCIHLVLLRALREASLEAGRGAVPAGLVATRHPGGAGAPPGTTRSPCQELADARRRV